MIKKGISKKIKIFNSYIPKYVIKVPKQYILFGIKIYKPKIYQFTFEVAKSILSWLLGILAYLGNLVFSLDTEKLNAFKALKANHLELTLILRTKSSNHMTTFLYLLWKWKVYHIYSTIFVYQL